jgi:lambda repressor-like predicted transcriptional regulator
VQAKQEGSKKRAKEIAAKIKKRGLPIDRIVEDAGLSPEEIAAL